MSVLDLVPDDRYRYQMAVCGVTCGKTGFTYTVLFDDHSIIDAELEAPRSMVGSRPELLSWLTDEAQRLFEANAVSDVRLRAPQSGGKFAISRERIELEAAVQIAAHRVDAVARMLNKEQVRAAFGIPRGAGAYDSLLAQDEVRARSNDARRHQYLLVKAPIV